MRIIAFACVIVVAGCSAPTLDIPNGIEGRFRSDKPSTMAYLKSTGSYNVEQMESLDVIHVQDWDVMYQGDTCIRQRGSRSWTQQFSVVESGPGYLVIERPALSYSVKLRHTIEFTEEGFWITTPCVKKPFKEKYRRMHNPTKPSTATE